MKIDAITEFDVVALEAEDDLTCLLTLSAPMPDDAASRQGEALIAVLDNSGSMAGDELDAAKQALHSLVDRMKPQDTFGVVTFSSTAEVAVPCRTVADHHLPSVHALIEGISAESTTDLGAGYVLGLSLAERARSATGASLLMLSDGHANEGVTDPIVLGRLASAARGSGTTTITIGIGRGYDEVLLHELASKGQGSHRFAYTPDDAVAVVAEEAGDLLNKVVMNAFVRIRPNDPDLVHRIGTLHDVPRWLEDGPDGPCIVLPMGDLYAGEQRELLVKFSLPGLAALGPHALGDIVVDYVALPGLEAKTVVWPVSVNVASADDASSRLPNPTVTTAVLLAEVTEAKRSAVEALGRGDAMGAERSLNAGRSRVQEAGRRLRSQHPERGDLRSRLLEEEAQLQRLATAARERHAEESRKSLMEDVSMNLRGRGDMERRQRARQRRHF